MGFFLEVLVGGLLAGVMYSMVAIGFVLIYKASGVFNFAQGSMVLFAALTFVGLVERGIHFWAALAITLAAMIVLSRRGERAAFGQMEGKVGQSAGALSTLRKGWYYDQEPVAADVARPQEIANAAVVFRALGRPGVVLLGEGPLPRAKKLIEKEVKKVNRVAPGVPVTQLYVGEGEGQIEVRKLPRTLAKLKPVITTDEMAQVNKRLKSIPGIRQGIPAGIDPTKARMDRRALRGR